MVKAHPACPISSQDHPEMPFTLVSQSLNNVIHKADVAFTGPVTAGVDAYCLGVPVVTLLDGEALNLSPLRNTPGVTFVSSAEDLANAFEVV